MRKAMCEEFSRCYDDVNICLWTNGSMLTQYDAQAACAQRNSFLPRITDWSVQYKLELFRAAADNGTARFFDNNGFWIDVNATNATSYQWLDGSSLAGLRAVCSVVFLSLCITTTTVNNLIITSYVAAECSRHGIPPPTCNNQTSKAFSWPRQLIAHPSAYKFWSS